MDIPIAIAIVVAWATIGVLTVKSYGNRGAFILAVCVGVIVVAQASLTWLPEPADYHFTNPELTRGLDWWAHFTISLIQIAMPAVLGLILSVLFTHKQIPTLLAIQSTALFVGLMAVAGIFLSLIPVVVFYHDGP